MRGIGGVAEVGAAVGLGAAATRSSSSPSSPAMRALSAPTATSRPRPGTSWPGWTRRCSPFGLTMIAYARSPVTVPARRNPLPRAGDAAAAATGEGVAAATVADVSVSLARSGVGGSVGAGS